MFGRFRVMAFRLGVQIPGLFCHLLQGLYTIPQHLHRFGHTGTFAQPESPRVQPCSEFVAESVRVGLADVMLVDPKEFFEIEAGCGTVDILDIEQVDHCVQIEYLLVAVGPSKPDQIIQQGFGQNSHVAEFKNTRRSMALGQLLAILSVDQRHMGENRQRRTQGMENVDLPGRVAGMVITTNHVGDPHVRVIHHNSQVVGRRPVAAGNHHIVQFTVADFHPSPNHILENHGTVQRIPEPDYR